MVEKSRGGVEKSEIALDVSPAAKDFMANHGIELTISGVTYPSGGTEAKLNFIPTPDGTTKIRAYGNKTQLRISFYKENERLKTFGWKRDHLQTTLAAYEGIIDS